MADDKSVDDAAAERARRRRERILAAGSARLGVIVGASQTSPFTPAPPAPRAPEPGPTVAVAPQLQQQQQPPQRRQQDGEKEMADAATAALLQELFQPSAVRQQQQQQPSSPAAMLEELMKAAAAAEADQRQPKDAPRASSQQQQQQPLPTKFGLADLMSLASILMTDRSVTRRQFLLVGLLVGVVLSFLRAVYCGAAELPDCLGFAPEYWPGDVGALWLSFLFLASFDALRSGLPLSWRDPRSVVTLLSAGTARIGFAVEATVAAMVPLAILAIVFESNGSAPYD